MFKRRKPEDDKPTPQPAPGPASAATPQPQQGSGKPIFPNRPADMPSTPNQPVKDQADMGRTPFPTPPSPNAAPARPTPAAAPAAAAPGAAGPGARRDGPERRTLVVGRGISVQGTVQDAERLVVEGTVEASKIHATELSVAQGGVLRGEIEVEDAEVAGTVDGALVVRGTLKILPTGRVVGKARYGTMSVEPGGQISGQFEQVNGVAARPAGEPITAARPAPVPETAEQG